MSGRLEHEGSEKSLSRTRSTDYLSADSGTSNEQVKNKSIFYSISQPFRAREAPTNISEKSSQSLKNKQVQTNTELV